MHLPYDMRRRARGLIVPTLSTLVAVYFGYHAIQGDRGLIAYSHYALEIKRVEAELAEIRAQRQHLAHQVSLLHPEHVDPDMLDEQVRRNLGLARPDEMIVFLKPPGSDDDAGHAR